MTLPTISPSAAAVLVAGIAAVTVLGWHDPDVGRKIVEVAAVIAASLAPGLLKSGKQEEGGK